MGNIGSIAKKIKQLGYGVIIANTPNEVMAAEKIILPGVGHFTSAVNKLKSNGLWDALNEKVLVQKTPILGICLGMQLMARHSDEGDCQGFGWFDAEVKRFEVSDTKKYKVPHMGWNSVKPVKQSVLFKDVDPEQGFYFVHSYYLKCNNPADNLAITNYCFNFTSAVQWENIFGLQFHPEKSHDAGTVVLKNFMNL